MNWDVRIAFAIVSGLGFALLGVAYRIGQLRGRSAKHIVMVGCGFAVVFFALRTDWAHMADLPWRVAITAAVSGLSQLITMTLVVIALRHGPFAPAWCAVSLMFVPVLFYGQFFLGDHIVPLQYVAVAAAIAAVISSAGAAADPVRPATRTVTTRPIIYGTLLLGILLANGLASIAIKDLSAVHVGTSNLIELYATPYLMIFYLALGLGVLVEQAIDGGLRNLDRVGLGLGVLGGVGSLCGFAAQARFAVGQSVLFTLSSAVILLGAALTSAAFFHEKVTRRWVATVALTLVAIVCATAPNSGNRTSQAHQTPLTQSAGP